MGERSEIFSRYWFELLTPASISQLCFYPFWMLNFYVSNLLWLTEIIRICKGHPTASKGLLNVAPACFASSPWSILRMSHCTSTTLAMQAPTPGSLHQLWPWLACSGSHLCTAVSSSSLWPQHELYCLREAICSYLSAVVLFECTRHSLSPYPVWFSPQHLPLFNLSYFIISWGRGLAYIVLCVPSTW